MTKGERAIVVLRECADVMDAMPFKRIGIFGPMVNTMALRDEADWLETQQKNWDDMNEKDCKPNLGCATTKELLLEIKARGEVPIGPYQEETDMAIGAANLLYKLPGSVLDYRTVDSH